MDAIKQYNQNMEKFIKINKQNINIERAKLMLKMSSESIKKINSSEQELIADLVGKKYKIVETDHLPFRECIHILARKLKGSP